MFLRLYADNFRSLSNFDLVLPRLGFLMGENASGKSSVFDVIYKLRLVMAGELIASLFPPSTRTRWDSRSVQTLEVDCELDKEWYRYHLTIEHDQGLKRARIAEETLVQKTGPLFSFKAGTVQLYRDDGSKGSQYEADWSRSELANRPDHPQAMKLRRFVEFMRSVVVCSLYPASFGAEATSEDPILARDGSNFVAWYRHMFQERQDVVPQFLDALRAALPGFKAFRLTKSGEDARLLVADFESSGGMVTYRLDELSDGQRALVALSALLHMGGAQHSALFLDEPDNYLALPEIQPWYIQLRDAIGSAAAQISQAIVISHHPEALDYAGAAERLILSRAKGGPTTVATFPLADVVSGLRTSEQIARGGWAQGG